MSRFRWGQCLRARSSSKFVKKHRTLMPLYFRTIYPLYHLFPVAHSPFCVKKRNVFSGHQKSSISIGCTDDIPAHSFKLPGLDIKSVKPGQDHTRQSRMLPCLTNTLNMSACGRHFRHRANTASVCNRTGIQRTSSLLWCFPSVPQFLQLFCNNFFLAYSFLPTGPL